nr:MAG TPA: hypothetical protein [Caudoviricetes sp.]
MSFVSAFHNFFLLLPLPNSGVWLKFWVYSPYLLAMCILCYIQRCNASIFLNFFYFYYGK